jgi:aspartate-semialdehyde dehydrogenase
MKLALVGATGLVGNEMIKVIEEFQLSIDEFIPIASAKSVGKTIIFNNKEYKIVSIEEAIEMKPEIVVYSAGSEISLKTAPLFAKNGTFVVDNSSAWRMTDNVPLVVPEVNLDKINKDTKIIANPNCSTIQLAVALWPLHKKYVIKHFVISTYPSITGTGVRAVDQLMSEREGRDCEKVYPHNIDMNCFPHGGNFIDNGYTTEEMKLINETHKIFDDYSIKISPTVVRIPVTGGHSESVYVEFENKIDIEDVKSLLMKSEGIVVQDDPIKNIYPMPITVKGKNETYVGRIRSDLFNENAIQMWVVADNLRKGAATNAIQIAKYIMENYIDIKC